MRTPWIVASIFASFFSSSSYSDFVGLNIGSSFWVPGVSGSFNSSNNSNVPVSNRATSDRKSNQSFSVKFEHPIPALPNVKFQNFALTNSSTADLNNVNFNGTNFNGNHTSNLDLSHNDLTLYYELLDNWVNLDLGLNLKQIDGDISVRDETIGINETIPQIYISARFDLPTTGFYVGADLQNISILSDNKAENSTLMVGYETSSGLGIEGGYKSFSINLDNASSLNAQLEYDGLYVNGYIHF
ncbi:MAG: TIGR04219 family outer membrane beta-barrel protein [Gammaproteobacteria bacterium]|nr:TIGR04219 family outer membrane beta-barrel protein [Gammaproteobacteria bacterium]